MEKTNNNLIKVTTMTDKSIHYYTNVKKIADRFGVHPTVINTAILKDNSKLRKEHDVKIEIVDGSDVKYKDIN